MPQDKIDIMNSRGEFEKEMIPAILCMENDLIDDENDEKEIMAETVANMSSQAASEFLANK